MILVTGGAGFIGSNLVASLNEKGVSEIAIDDHVGNDGKEKNLRKRKFRELLEPGDLKKWLEGRKLEAILHMGAISSTTVTDEKAVMAANYELPMRLLDWCAENRVPFIYASSAATYGDGRLGFDDDDTVEGLAKLQPLNLYGRSKLRFDIAVAERAAAKQLLPPQWAGLKYFNVFGPNEYHKGEMMSVLAKRFPDAKAGKAVALFKSDREGIPDGGQSRDFIYVKDAAAMTLWFLDHPAVSGIYNIGTGIARSFRDQMIAMFRSLKRDPNIEYVPMPRELSGRYQYMTRARMDRLRAAGYDAPFMTLEAAVEDYVTNYLNRPDPYR